MSLRRKTLIIIGLTIISLIAILYAASRIILLGSFAALEEQYTHQNVERALDALFDDFSALDSIVSDWAAWDDTYVFIEDANEDYIQSNLVDETFINFRLNFMLFINSSGQIVFGKGFDLHNEGEISIPQSLQEHLTDNAPLLHHPDTESSVAGIILLPEGPVLVASRPILTSMNEGPIRGTLIMGRYLDSAEIDRLAEIEHLSLIVHRFDDASMPLDFQAVRSSLSEEKPIIVRSLSEESIAGYALIEDIYGKPSLVLRADRPRDIYKQGQAGISYFMLSLLSVGLVFGVVSLLHLDRLILSRVARLSRSVSDIGTSGDLSARMTMPGRDALSNLADAINGMLEELEQSAEALRESEERFRSLSASAPVGIFLTDAEGQCIYANARLQAICGLTPDETLGYGWGQAIHPDDREAVLEEVSKMTSEGREFSRELRILTPWAELHWVHVRVTAMFSEAGEQIGDVGTVEDITGRKQAEEELQQSFKQLRKALEGTVNTLVSAIELRDPYTAGHQRRVTQLACAIAKEMGLPEERIEGIRMAGLIHDIGKINVPAEILSKPGQLTDLEFGLIKMHPQVGHDVLNGTIEFPWPLAQIVLQHHERMDGSGYPQGLSGEEIILEARILGVADVVEAMASHRPYRSARGIDEALEEISQNRGVLYDPEVVDTCLKLFTESGFELR